MAFTLRLSCLSLAVALAAGPALAVEKAPDPPAAGAPASQDFHLNATTPKLCKLGAANPSSVAVGVLVQISGASVGRLRTDLGDITVTVPAWCNTSSAMAVTAQAMLGPALSDSSATTVFGRAVNFRARSLGWTVDAAAPSAVSAADRIGAGQPSVTGTPADVSGPQDADLNIHLDQFAAPDNALLVSGDYAGSVTVTITPL